MNTTVVVVVLSGGQDSTTCLFDAINRGHNVHAISFDYGQRHRIELQAAKHIAAMAAVPHKVVELGPILEGTSPLVSGNELEQYSDHHSLPGGLEKTFVPMRNQLFLTVAANYAYVIGATQLWTGVCEEDFGGYPDCRQVFINAVEAACNTGTFTGKDGAPGPLRIVAPLMNLTKAQSVMKACSMHGCYAALAWSHTGYDGAYPPTGKDHATLLRAKGFEQAGIPDPLILRAWKHDLMELPTTGNYNPIILQASLRQLKREGEQWATQ